MNGKSRLGLFSALLLATAVASATSAKTQDVLVKLAPTASVETVFSSLPQKDLHVEPLFGRWYRVQLPAKQADQLQTWAESPAIESTQPNYSVHLLEDYRLQDPLQRAALIRARSHLQNSSSFNAEFWGAPKDNPAIPLSPIQGQVGADPNFSHQWGMIDTGVQEAWNVTIGSPNMIVAVIDTGVDYTHEDLAPNMWHNPGEMGMDANGHDKATNGIDDDANGYVDDVVGWDFASNDNKPYDLSVSTFQILIGGGNPGHGTHCAGNIGARGDNGIGISGVNQQVQIMAVRFLNEKGSGQTADAIKAIKYAVDNGAKVLSNSWGSEGEDTSNPTGNQALRDVIQYAQDHGVLFIAAAGNGHSGVGYDNDTDSAPGYPASYANENIVSVAAIDSQDHMGSFSNWGANSVDIAAPGVSIYSTMVSNRYSDKVVDIAGFSVPWDGTSMATPHVSGAAALYWSAHPEKTWQDVKAAIIGSARKIDAMNGKCVSNGKLDVKALLSY